MRLAVELEIRSMDYADLSGLEWSGESNHLQALAETLQRGETGAAESLVACVAAARSVGCGVVDFTRYPDAGELTMLSVHPLWQSLGVGTALIAALEERIRDRGLDRARISVEHDNPAAAALYRRLGYRTDGSRLDGWSLGGRRHYVTVCDTMLKPLLGG